MVCANNKFNFNILIVIIHSTGINMDCITYAISCRKKIMKIRRKTIRQKLKLSYFWHSVQLMGSCCSLCLRVHAQYECRKESNWNTGNRKKVTGYLVYYHNFIYHRSTFYVIILCDLEIHYFNYY